MNGPNGAGDRSVSGVFARVRRDRQVSNLLYGLLGAEDERDPEGALASLATSAAATLDVCGPEYRVRVVRALQLLTGLVLDSAEHAPSPALVDAHRALTAEYEGDGTVTTANSDEDRLIDPDCAAGKHGSCIGGPCECDCHPEPGSGKSAGQQYLQHAVIDVTPLGSPPGSVTVPAGHPFEPSPNLMHGAHTCRTCGEPSGAVEHFTPTGLLNTPAVAQVVLDPDAGRIHPVTGHPLPPCPTCGVLPPQHTPACADQDDDQAAHGGHTWGVLTCKACADQDAG